MKYLTWRGWLSARLEAMTAHQLLNLTLIFSAASASSDQLVWWFLDRPEANFWIDVWPMFIGNALGAFLMLHGMKFVLDQSRLVQKMRSD